ncbi:MAG TPA: divalent metal cation transporter [Armatimonadota bacterium]|nr:divalent metal cation transporter [Armatimonadota bacterium]HOS43477.1 divalent metal cation transporter [Armatimonadota bacterium]
MTPTKRRARWLAYLAVLGPGILAAVAGNDAGGVYTYASAGAEYAFRMLWLLFVITIALIVVQEMCARMGAVTGKGLSDLIRENFGVRWTLVAMLALLVANSFITMSEFAGIASALSMFGVPGYVSVPLIAAAVWLLVVKGDYGTVEKGLMVIALLFLAYPIAAFLEPVPWGTVLQTMLVPSGQWIEASPHFILLGIGIIGTTVAPWMQFYVQASVVDKGVRAQDLPLQRADIFSGGIVANLVAFFIIVVTATAFLGRHQPIGSALDAATALRPVAGNFASLLFAAGLLGASVMGALAVPLTTAYAVSEAFGWERGLGQRFRQAPLFYGLYTFIIAISALVVMVISATGKDAVLIEAILRAQQISGMITPIILVFILLLINNPRLMGRHTNSRVYNVIAWGTVALVGVFILAWLATELLPGLLG